MRLIEALLVRSGEIQRRFRVIPIGHRLTTSIACVAVTFAIVASAIASIQAADKLEVGFVQHGTSLAGALASGVDLSHQYTSSKSAERIAAQFISYPEVQQVLIFDLRRDVVVSRRAANVPLHVAQEARTSSELLQKRIPRVIGDSMAFSAPILDEDNASQVIGYVEVVIGKQPLRQMILSIWVGNFMVTAIMGFIALALLRLLGNNTLRPLLDLSAQLKRAKQGEYDAPTLTGGPRDIAEMSAALNDILEQLGSKRESLLQARVEAVKDELIRDQLAATISQEVRTPLNSVMGVLQLMKSTKLDERQREYLEKAWRSSVALADAVDDALHIATMKSGTLQCNDAPVDLRRLVEEAIDAVSAEATGNGPDVGYHLDESVPEMIIGDQLKLRQILLHLLTNAMNSTTSGEVGLRLSMQRGSANSAMLKIEVRDTGNGIPEAELGKVFDMFNISGESLGDVRKFGFGLALTRNLVEVMGGRMSVESTVGVGSAFTASIPFDASHLKPVVLRTHQFKDRRILVCAQAEIVKEFLTSTFQRYGAQCDGITAPEEGWGMFEKMIKATHYDLIILDSKIENAARIAQRAMALSQFKGTKVVLLGASLAEGEAYVHGKWAKPLTLDRVLSGANSMFASNSAFKVDSEGRPAVLSLGLRVLLVEDNASNRQIMQSLLSEIGCSVMTAIDGIAALEAMTHRRCDVVLMDCMMPLMDGYEATTRIRSWEARLGRRTPIVGLTANTQEGASEKCFAAGMDDYLAKPVKIDDLVEKLNAWTRDSHR